MLQVKNSVPLIFLGIISGTFVLLSIYHFWFKRQEQRRRSADEEAIEYDDHGEQIFGAAKKRKPKLWVVQIPRLGRPKLGPSAYEDDEDELDEKDAGKWDMIKVGVPPHFFIVHLIDQCLAYVCGIYQEST